jgi:hypothetical protein
MTTVEILFLGVYFAVLCVLAGYGSHRYRMAYLYYRHKFRIPIPSGRLPTLPRVTIQLPVFNEMYVVERLIESVCRIEYPRELLEVQVLDIRPTRPAHRPCCGGRQRPAGHGSSYCTPNRKGSRPGAGQQAAHRDRNSSPSSTPTSSPPGLLGPHRALLRRCPGGDGAVRWGHLNREFSISPRPRASSSTATSSSSTPPGTGQRLLQLQRTRDLRRSTSPTPVAGSDTLPGPGPQLPGPAQGVAFHLPPRGHLPGRVPVDMNAFRTSSTAGPRARSRPRALARILKDAAVRGEAEAFFPHCNLAYL